MHAGASEGHYKTRTGSLIGTPVYMSPEQCRGAGEVDHRTDIYSLGCILFEMLAGRPPFTYEGFGELIQAHLSTTPPRARRSRASVTPAAEALIARLLAKSPDGRPQTMRELVTELDAVIAGTASGAAAPPGERGPAPRPVVRTVLLPENEPPRHTTLGAASSEKLDAVSETRGGGAIPVRRGRWPFVAAAALLVAGAAGFALWPGQRSPAPDEARRPPPQVTPSTPEPPTEKPAAVVKPDPPAARPVIEAKHDVTARPEPTRAARTEAVERAEAAAGGAQGEGRDLVRARGRRRLPRARSRAAGQDEARMEPGPEHARREAAAAQARLTAVRRSQSRPTTTRRKRSRCSSSARTTSTTPTTARSAERRQ
jgi:hypothetical protein